MITWKSESGRKEEGGLPFWGLSLFARGAAKEATIVFATIINPKEELAH